LASQNTRYISIPPQKKRGDRIGFSGLDVSVGSSGSAFAHLFNVFAVFGLLSICGLFPKLLALSD